MRLSNLKFVLMLLFFAQFSWSQEAVVKELQEKYPVLDVVYLAQEYEIDIFLKDGELQITRGIKEKKALLTNRANNYEKELIYFYGNSKIKNLKAKSTSKLYGSYKKHKVNDFKTLETISDQYFYDDSKAIQFTYPNVAKGNICEMSYEQDIEQALFVPRLFLKSSIPIEYLRVQITVDKRIDFDIQEFNVTEELNFVKKEKGKNVIYELELKNIESIDLEPNGPSYLALIPHLAININSYDNDGSNKKVLGNLDNLYSTYTGFIDSIDLKTNDEFSAKVDSIVGDQKSELLKVESIYNWVKKNIKYVAFEDNMGGFIPRDPQFVFDRKFGDCKDMTSIIVKMMKVAGLDGRYAWVGTRDLPYQYTSSCGAFVDNHMIAVYVSPTDQKVYYLDATNEHLPFGLAPPHIQEKEVLIYKDKENYQVELTPVSSCSLNRNEEHCDIKIEEENLVGSFTNKLTGYEYSKFQRIFSNLNTEQIDKRYQTYYAKGSNKSKVSNIRIESDNHIVETNFDIEIQNYISLSGEEIYVNMNLEKLIENAKIEDTRKQALDLGKTFNYTKNYKLQIPEDYSVSYLPKDFVYSDNDYSASIKYLKNENSIEYQYELCVDTLWITKDNFDKWTKFIKKLRKNYKENVILKKK